jgi:hypothetical protein
MPSAKFVSLFISQYDAHKIMVGDIVASLREQTTILQNLVSSADRQSVVPNQQLRDIATFQQSIDRRSEE